MNLKLTNSIKVVAIICACLLFLAIFRLPIEYYMTLRVIVFIGALLVISTHHKEYFIWPLIFFAIAILFNPIFPIYLYIKAYWIPLDIVSGILFLLIAFKKRHKKKKEIKKASIQKTYDRDRIYK